MKITISKSQWQEMGKKAGWMKKEAVDISQQIGGVFKDMAGGIQESAKAKVQEYAQRIMKGEPKDQVLQGIGPSMKQNVEQALVQMQTGTAVVPQQPQQKEYTSQQIVEWSRKTSPEYQKAIARIMSGADKEQMKTLNKAISGDVEARKWLQEYTSAMNTAK